MCTQKNIFHGASERVERYHSNVLVPSVHFQIKDYNGCIYIESSVTLSKIIIKKNLRKTGL